MFKLQRPVGRRPFYLALIAISLLAVLAIFLWKIGSYTPGAAPGELSSKSQSLSMIIDNPINAPYKLTAWAVLKVPHHSGLLLLRLSSVIFSLLFILSFTWLAVKFFGTFSGLLGSLIFLSVPLVIVLGRQASPDIMLLSPALLMALYYWQERRKQRRSSWLVLLVLTAVCLYIPGVNWWILLAAVFCLPKIWQDMKSTGWLTNLLACILVLLLLVPLLLSILKGSTNLHSLFLIPSHLSSPVSETKSIGQMLLALFWQAPHHYATIIGKLPILNIIAGALSLFGAYALWSAALRKTYGLIGAILLATILAGLNQNIDILALALPAIGIFVCAGLRWLWIEWRSVFPRNPIARALAITALCLVVVVNLLFGLRYSLVAWPNTMETQRLYVLK